MPMQAQMEAEVQLQPIHKLSARRERIVSTIARPFSQKRPMPVVQEDGWALGVLWIGMENTSPPRLSTLKKVLILTTLFWLPLFTYHITRMGTV